MTTTMPSRQDVDRAGDLDFNTTRSEKDVSICIEAAPDGLHVRVDYVGSLSSIPAAIERLKRAGVLELVAPARATPAPTALRKSAPVTFADDGTPLCGNANCSRRGQPLEPSQHNGYYCKGKDSITGNPKGYCKTTSD